MGMLINCELLLIFVLIVIDAESSDTINIDQSSLLSFKSHITSDPHNILTNNWTIQTSVCSWIGVTCGSRHNRVTELDISNMGLVGPIPPEIGNLSFLVSLNMSENLFHGPIPLSIFNMSRLQVIALRNNSLYGSLPKDMCNNLYGRRLRVFRASYNRLYGEIPSSLDQCSQLEEIYLYGNDFSGNVLRGFGNITRLKLLFLGSNNFAGHLPTDLFNQFPQLQLLEFSSSGLRGPLPTQIGNLTSLQELHLFDNSLSGPIPNTIGNLSQLIFLDLHSNKLRGDIPSSVCKLTYLQFLHLSHNSLEGSIPHCLRNLSRSLAALHLKGNQLRGLIPEIFTKVCVLQSLSINGNKFEGPLPTSLVNCVQLQVLDVGNNEIQDTFPFWIETLPVLRVLVLRFNRFYGTIFLDPKTTSISFPSLQVFDISHNEFTGSLPARYLENFVSMINVKVNRTTKRNWFSPYYTEESMVFVLKGVVLSVVRISNAFTTIDLSSNRFSGTIPRSIGKLNSLRYLNLSRNNIIGNIPASLGNISMLESLDLSSNQLAGEIPLQLTRLTFLSILNLSFNNLVGKIPQPSTGQFSTFENNSYMGNSGLCGFPLTKKCKQDNVQTLFPVLPQGDNDSNFMDGFTWQAVVLGYGCGFVFGTTISYFIFRYQRPKWFVGLFFNAQDKIHSNKKRNVARRRT
ncbi:hypothetical protein ABFX02_14G082100 [Erythranthe guttata]